MANAEEHSTSIWETSRTTESLRSSPLLCTKEIQGTISRFSFPSGTSNTWNEFRWASLARWAGCRNFWPWTQFGFCPPRPRSYPATQLISKGKAWNWRQIMHLTTFTAGRCTRRAWAEKWERTKMTKSSWDIFHVTSLKAIEQGSSLISVAMLRACRLVVDTGVHYLGWSRQEAIDFIYERTSETKNRVAREVDRYITWPGQVQKSLPFHIERSFLNRLWLTQSESVKFGKLEELGSKGLSNNSITPRLQKLNAEI